MSPNYSHPRRWLLASFPPPLGHFLFLQTLYHSGCRAWSSGCFSSNLLPSDLSPFAGFKFHMLTIPISSSDLLRLQDTHIQLPTWCLTLMDNRHLKLNMSTYNPWLLPFPTNLFLPITHSGYWGCHSWLLFFSQLISNPSANPISLPWKHPEPDPAPLPPSFKPSFSFL